MHVPRSAVPPGDAPALRALLPLPLVPARNGERVRAERDDRSRSRHAAAGKNRRRADAVQQRQGPEDFALPRMPDCRVEQLRGGGRRRALRPRRYAGRARLPAAGHPHLHRLEATVGGAAGGRAGGVRVLRSQRALAGAKVSSGATCCSRRSLARDRRSRSAAPGAPDVSLRGRRAGDNAWGCRPGRRSSARARRDPGSARAVSTAP